MSKNRAISNLRELTKQFKFTLYISVIMSSISILIKSIIQVKTTIFYAIISLFFTIIILINVWRTIFVYKRQKNKNSQH